MKDFLENQLREVRAQNLHRSLREVESSQGARIRIEGREVHNFSSNDYLGLAADPALKQASSRAVERFGTGGGASRLISGNLSPCRELEQELTRFKKAEAAVVFSSGYAAAMGAIPALVRDGDTVIMDKLCHASLIDAARLSGAALRVYPHLRMDKLAGLLDGAAARKKPDSNILVITETVFSMDGDVAPLDRIVDLKRKHGAWLLIDEAHGTGVFGKHGRGAAELFGVESEIDVTLGTLGKALGSAGGSISGSKLLIEFLVNRARSLIFSTAMPPAAYATAAEALRQIEARPGLREKLWKNVERLARALGRPPASFSSNPDSSAVPFGEARPPWGRPVSPIVPVEIGEETRAVEVSRRLFDAGYFVPAIRYPTVARGKARLRVSISASHTEQQINGLANALEQIVAGS